MDLLNKLAANVSVDKIRNLAEDAINQAKPKTDVEARIYEALSHKNWGSSSTLMNEIARDTFDYERFSIVTMILWESLSNPRPAAWRVVFKGLNLLEHLIKNGSERCVDDARTHSHVLRNLHNFNYYEGTVDRGVGIREKSRQLVELLADDERVREERIKAKQLREKFGGNMGGVSNIGSMQGFGGGGGGGSSSYPGYGNNTDESNYGGYHGSGSYGNSGIGSSTGAGAFHDSTDRGFSGRYSEENGVPVAPTFATLPEKKHKKKISKKDKKKENSDLSPAAPEIDLLALNDDQVPVSLETESFDAFQSAGVGEDNVFDAFQSAPSMNTSTEFDAFGSMQPPLPPPPPPPQQAFDAFSSAPSFAQPSFDAFSTRPSSIHDMFGNMNVGSSNNTIHAFGGGAKASVMGAGLMARRHPQINQQDEFGDFDDGVKSRKVSSDPLANLISLDSLTKNKKKQEDKTNEPIAFNDAAKQYIQKGEPSKPVTMSKEAADFAFSGVDGLPKHNTAPMMHMNGINHNLGHKSSVIMSGSGMNSNTIDNVFPDLIAQRSQIQQQQLLMQQQRMMMMQQQQQYQLSGMSTGNATNSHQQDPNAMHNFNTGQMGGFGHMGGQGIGTGGMGGKSMKGWR